MQNIFLIGPMGAGKSTIGKLLSQSLKLTFLDTDSSISERCGVKISTIFEIEGEAGFRQRECKIIEEFSALSGIVLSTGGGAILSDKSRNLLASRGLVIYLSIDAEEQYRRTKGDRNRPLLQTGNPMEKLIELFDIRHPLYSETCDYICCSKNQMPQRVAQEITNLYQSLQNATFCYTPPVWLQRK